MASWWPHLRSREPKAEGYMSLRMYTEIEISSKIGAAEGAINLHALFLCYLTRAAIILYIKES